MNFSGGGEETLDFPGNPALSGGHSGQFPTQPGTGQPKLMPDDVNGAACGVSHFFGRHPAEVEHLDHLRQRLVFARERL